MGFANRMYRSTIFIRKCSHAIKSIREEYSKWRQKYTKGDFDPVRYENFKANFLAVTIRNNMERSRARQNGEPAPSPIQLNEYGDCSSGEYRQAMTRQQNNRNMISGPNRTSPNARANTMSNGRGLQPSNTVIGNKTAARRKEDLSKASAQLRSVVEQRINLENELTKLKRQLAEKQKLLQAAANEEKLCQERVALREEQKRILNDRLTNG